MKNPTSGCETGGNAGMPYGGGNKPSHVKHVADHMLTTKHNGDHKASMTHDRLLMGKNGE